MILKLYRHAQSLLRHRLESDSLAAVGGLVVVLEPFFTEGSDSDGPRRSLTTHCGSHTVQATDE